MEEALTHDIELYSLESFKTLLEHEIHRSRRYKQPLSLIHLAVEADPSTPQTQHSAEVFAINILNLQLRETDIPCKMGSEFLVLLPSTDQQGGQVACERLEKLFRVTHQTYDRVSFQLSAFIGMTSADGTAPLHSSKLIEQATAAMQHARVHRSQNAVLFSEISKDCD
jgi:PleD family two-component response regulator